MKKVVIVVPAYQCESTIAETLESLQQQGDPLERVHEVIVADDASRDGTRDVARKVWKSNTPLRILEPPRNRGEYVNVNETVAGLAPDIEWILIMHGDNVAKAGWLTTLLDRIAVAADGVGTISTSWDDWRLDGSKIPGENATERGVEEVPGTRDAVRGTLKKGCWWHISSCAIRVSAYKQVGGLPAGLRLKGDWDFMLRLLAAGWSIEYIPRALMLYRENPGGSSSLTFRLHKDVKETLQVVRWHQDALSLGLTTRLHVHCAWMLFRRCAAGVLRMDWRRIVAACPAAFGIVTSFAKCLFRVEESRPAPMSQSPTLAV